MEAAEEEMGCYAASMRPRHKAAENHVRLALQDGVDDRFNEAAA